MYRLLAKPIIILSFFLATLSTNNPETLAAKSLYQRLGGYDGIAATVDGFFGRLIADKAYGRFFDGMADDRKKLARQLTVDYICAAAGGPCVYNGRDMVKTHKGMKISTAEWNASILHLTATLNKLKVPESEQKEVLKMIDGLRGQIVEN